MAVKTLTKQDLINENVRLTEELGAVADENHRLRKANAHLKEKLAWFMDLVEKMRKEKISGGIGGKR